MRSHRKALQERFVAAVRSGTKTTTIRPLGLRKWRPKAGDALTLFRWTGRPYRSKQEEVGVFRVKDCRTVVVWMGGVAVETLVGETKRKSDRDQIAIREGFKDWPDMAAWFIGTHGLPFTGMLIEWEARP